MFEGIDPRSPTPLYAQIAAHIRVAVASGEVRSGDALPSVRALAQSLRVNPATVVQAYRELAMDGFVEMRHGAGTFRSDYVEGRGKRGDGRRDENVGGARCGRGEAGLPPRAAAAITPAASRPLDGPGASAGV